MDSRKPVEPSADDSIDTELEFHFAETIESLVERGWSESAARIEAERRFGDRRRYRRDLEKDRPDAVVARNPKRRRP